MNHFLSKLLKLEGAVISNTDPLLNCVQTPSPSVNWTFGIPGHGLPFGYTMLLYGPPKGGKSILCNAIIGQLHKDYPQSIAIYYNTELRGAIQQGTEQQKIWGIDSGRIAIFDTNQPEFIFDRIENDIASMCQDGAEIKLIVIDSLKGVQGRRAANSTSVLTQQIGDEAATIQDGLKRIIPVIRKYKIALILTTHIRAELDPREQMRGKNIKMAAAWAGKHMAEFFAYVEPNRTKEGRTTLEGQELVDETIKDVAAKPQKIGHKIRFRIEENTLGVAGRTAEFTIDYSKGIINTHEEIFILGKNLGIIQRPTNVTYQYKERIWKGAGNCLMALRDEAELAREILKEIYQKDLTNYKP